MRIKDRFIKLLGGFTKDEVFGPPISKLQFVTRQHAEVVTLKAAVKVPEGVVGITKDIISDRLAHMFAEQIIDRADLMPVTKMDHDRSGFDEYSATIKMVVQEDVYNDARY